MELKIKCFFDTYDMINEIVRSILSGIQKSGNLGTIRRGSNGEYAFVEINYLSYGEELTKNICIPYKLLETGNGKSKFIAEQITNFYNFS